jgi:hypothetical protein
VKLTKVAGGGSNCGDGDTCPDKYDTDDCDVVFVGPEVTDPADRAQLAIGAGETAVRVPPEIATKGLWLPDPAALGAFLSRTRHDLIRQQALDAYDVASDGGDLRRYLAGEPAPDPGRKAAWHDRLRTERDRGMFRRNVHIVHGPLSSYLRYCFDWSYAQNAHLVDYRVLDLTEQAAPDPLVLDEVFVADYETVVLMHYGASGRFFGASVLPPQALDSYGAAVEAAWDAAVPFPEWWDGHPQYHRHLTVA